MSSALWLCEPLVERRSNKCCGIVYVYSVLGTVYICLAAALPIAYQTPCPHECTCPSMLAFEHQPDCEL